jgi:Holliday junction resolvasome RuvABC ATP-dependent DNA helicase subunit
MFTNKYRPKTIDQLCGQPLIKEAVRAIVKNPEDAPRVYIFHGEFGTGKTSAARLLARMLNGPDVELSHVSSFFREYDSSIAGSKEEIMLMREDLFTLAIGAAYRVIVLDEFHLASRQGQATLLKTLEDLPENIFIVFCTTRVDKILPTIRSRAVELAFQAVPDEDLKYHLIKVVNSEGIEVEDGILDYIVRRSHGHVRDAVMMLDSYQCLGDTEAFLTVYRDASEDILALLGAIRLGQADRVEAVIGRLTGYPVEVVREDIFQVVRALLKSYTLRVTSEDAAQTVAPSGGPESESVDATGDPGAQGQAPVPLYITDSHSGKNEQLNQLNPYLPPLQYLQGPDLQKPGTPHAGPEGAATTCTPETYGTLVSQYGRSLLDLLAFLSTDWAVNCLADMARCESLLWSLFSRFRSREQGASLSQFKKR